MLRERNFGDLRGLSYDSLGYDPLTMEQAPTNGESKREFEQRVVDTFEALVKRRSSLMGDIVVVTHGLWIKAMLSHLSETFGALQVPQRVGNTALTILSKDPPYTARLINCTQHIDGSELSETTSSLSGG